MSFATYMLKNPVMLWDEWFVALCGCLVWISCFFVLNRLPPQGQWVAKTLTTAVGLGGFGLMISPFFGHYASPSFHQLLFYGGVASHAVWRSWPYWHEIPSLDRRAQERTSGETKSARAG